MTTNQILTLLAAEQPEKVSKILQCVTAEFFACESAYAQQAISQEAFEAARAQFLASRQCLEELLASSEGI